MSQYDVVHTAGVSDQSAFRKAVTKDPRGAINPYHPRFQADQIQFAQIKQLIAEHRANNPVREALVTRLLKRGLGRYLGFTDARGQNVQPAQYVQDHSFFNTTPLKQTPFICQLTVVNTPVLLLPHNPRRLGFVIGNNDVDTIFFSYRPPLRLGSGVPLGIPIGAALGVFPNGAGYFPGSNAQASTDEIWVWVRTVVPQFVVAYEATLPSPEELGSS